MRSNMARLTHGRMGNREVMRVGMLMMLPILAIAAALVLTPGSASAHAGFGSSDPAPNSVLKAAPTVITIHFVENVNPQGSDIVVFDATHKQVSTAHGVVSTTDLKTMTVAMAGDGEGTYLVEWHNVSADDGDPDIGAFTFTVSATAQATPAPVGTGNATSGGSSGTPAWLTVLIGLIGLTVGGGGGYFAARTNRPWGGK